MKETVKRFRVKPARGLVGYYLKVGSLKKLCLDPKATLPSESNEVRQTIR